MARFPTPPPAHRREFVTDLTRQARTALSSILGYSEILGEELGVSRPELVSDLSSIRQAGEDLVGIIDALELRVDNERRRATVDVLTGLFNRRYLIEVGGPLLQQARERQEPLSLLIFDIDDLKLINDTLGHKAGDEVIQAIGGRAVSALRDEDTLVRLGGDEFVALLPNTSSEQAAMIIAERLRLSIGNSAIATTDGKQVAVTISAGVSTLDDANTDLAALIHAADRALLAAKRGGRDRVHFADSTDE